MSQRPLAQSIEDFGGESSSSSSSTPSRRHSRGAGGGGASLQGMGSPTITNAAMSFSPMPSPGTFQTPSTPSLSSSSSSLQQRAGGVPPVQVLNFQRALDISSHTHIHRALNLPGGSAGSLDLASNIAAWSEPDLRILRDDLENAKMTLQDMARYLTSQIDTWETWRSTQGTVVPFTPQVAEFHTQAKSSLNLSMNNIGKRRSIPTENMREYMMGKVKGGTPLMSSSSQVATPSSTPRKRSAYAEAEDDDEDTADRKGRRRRRGEDADWDDSTQDNDDEEDVDVVDIDGEEEGERYSKHNDSRDDEEDDYADDQDAEEHGGAPSRGRGGSQNRMAMMIRQRAASSTGRPRGKVKGAPSRSGTMTGSSGGHHHQEDRRRRKKGREEDDYNPSDHDEPLTSVPVPAGYDDEEGEPEPEPEEEKEVKAGVQANVFWQAMEQYFRHITDADLDFIAPTSLRDDDPALNIPALGTHYAQVWASEDGDDRRHGRMSGRKGAMDDVHRFEGDDGTDREDQVIVGDLTQRVLQALFEENLVIPHPSSPSDDKPNNPVDDLITSEGLLPPVNNYNKTSMYTLEERLRLELRDLGLLEGDDEPTTTAVAGADREDDEICIELRALQKQLREQVAINNARKEEILSQIQPQLAAQEQERQRRLEGRDAELRYQRLIKKKKGRGGRHKQQQQQLSQQAAAASASSSSATTTASTPSQVISTPSQSTPPQSIESPFPSGTT
eukprot:TRINITY_DN5225_c0_g1_i3.p1 TRINITY_DN5225_c0_g1~~TRINITY_DN5225_c0_g1_i3.p1  ORF type:complete len:728 (-),score=252.91 TRINITY_DN5225_c0_g1_i3:211-2394(-)